MDKYFLEGNWHVISGRLKQAFGEITDDDLVFMRGEEEVLLGKLQKKLGKSREELLRIMENHFQSPE